jgi:hypothetical protein
MKIARFLPPRQDDARRKRQYRVHYILLRRTREAYLVSHQGYDNR